MAGISLGDYAVTFARANLLSWYPGERWPARQAHTAAQYLKGSLGAQGHNIIVLLGRRVATAFGYPRARWFEWVVDTPGDTRQFIVVPHPSGRNRWWNDSCHAQLARIFWRTIAKHWWEWRG